MLRSIVSVFALVPLALAGLVPRQGPNTVRRLRGL
jgi:hypothetical protein